MLEYCSQGSFGKRQIHVPKTGIFHRSEESTKTIASAGETLRLISQIVSSSSNEINIIFPIPDTAKQFLSEGVFDSMNDCAQIQLRILIKRNRAAIDSCLADEVHSEIENLIGCSHLHIELQFVLNLQTQIITIIVDREKLLSVELRDESKNCLLN